VTSITLSAYRAPELRLPRLLAGVSYYHPTALAEHEELYGPLPLPASHDNTGRRWPESLIDLVERSGLTGRGGAGFPTGKKMRSVAAREGKTVVVANGAEGEPASCKDRLLLTRAPHLILDGITLAAYAVGADEAHLVVHAQEADLMASLDDAIADREARLVMANERQKSRIAHGRCPAERPHTRRPMSALPDIYRRTLRTDVVTTADRPSTGKPN